MPTIRVRGLKLNPMPFPKAKDDGDGYRLDTVERWAVTRALHKCNGSVKVAAVLLGCDPRTVERKIDKYGLRAKPRN